MGEQLLLDDSNLPDYLRNLDLTRAGEGVSVEKAGDGNINWVRRARCPDGRSWVVKQARPALERFPEYRVSTQRILVEARYYEAVAGLDRQRLCPQVVYFDSDARVLVLEDLGDAERLDRAQAREAGIAEPARRIAGFLGAVHAGVDTTALTNRFANDEMRRLHGDHIFQLPYRENDFPLSPPLRARAAAIQRDRELVGIIDAAHARYLEPRGALVHGDVQSANVLLPEGRTVLLDAEIAHVGDPAFDLGVFLAHLWAPALARGTPGSARALLEATWEAYGSAGGRVAFRDVARYAGIELMRRTIGAARMPWVENEEGAERVLEAGIALTRRAPDAPGELGR